MSTVIYEKDLFVYDDEFYRETETLVVSRYARGENKSSKSGYQISIGGRHVKLDAKQMEELMRDLNVFFYAEGYP